MARLEWARVPAFKDNYIWLLHDAAYDSGTGACAVVDPGDGQAALAAAAARGWTISTILNTHWHADHVGGNAEIIAQTGCAVIGPAGEAARIPGLTRAVGEGDRVDIGTAQARVLDVPGHTAGHIAFYFPDDGLLFCGDTLFAMGCGRLFEGTPAQMFDSLDKFKALPPDTQVFCAHEYTLANGHFAQSVLPGDPALTTRLESVAQSRERGEATVPFTLADDLATNPFLRADSVAHFAQLRAAKDVF